VQFTWTPATTAGANDHFSLDDLQVEVVPTGIASVAPLFERTDFSWDLMRCKRFLPVYNAFDGANRFIGPATCNGSSTALVFQFFNSETRVPPTGLTVSSAAFFSLAVPPAQGTGTGLNFLGCTTYNGTLQIGIAATSLSAGSAGYWFSTNTSAQILWTGCEI